MEKKFSLTAHFSLALMGDCPYKECNETSNNGNETMILNASDIMKLAKEADKVAVKAMKGKTKIAMKQIRADIKNNHANARASYCRLIRAFCEAIAHDALRKGAKPETALRQSKAIASQALYAYQ